MMIELNFRRAAACATSAGGGGIQGPHQGRQRNGRDHLIVLALGVVGSRYRPGGVGLAERDDLGAGANRHARLKPGQKAADNRLDAAGLGIEKVELVDVAFSGDAGGAADDVFGGRLGNPLDHLGVHQRGIELPNLLVVRPQKEIGDPFAEGHQEELQHVLRRVLGIRIVEEGVEAILFVGLGKCRQLVLERILDQPAVVPDAIRAAELMDVIAQDADHQFQDSGILGEHDVGTDVVVDVAERKRAAQTAGHVIPLQDVDGGRAAVLLQQVGQRNAAQPAAKNCQVHA